MADNNNPFASQVTDDDKDSPPAEPGQQDPASDDQQDSDDDRQDDRPGNLDAMKHALKKANTEAARFRKQLQDIADKDKSELQRLTERAEKAEEDARLSSTKALRLEVATSKGLTPALAGRLQGSTREELEADAEELLKLTGGTAPTRTRHDPDQGRRDTSSPNDSTDMNQLIRRVVSR